MDNLKLILANEGRICSGCGKAIPLGDPFRVTLGPSILADDGESIIQGAPRWLCGDCMPAPKRIVKDSH